MTTASISDGETTFSMALPDSGWDPATSPTPAVSGACRSGLVVTPIYGRIGDAGQDAGAHSESFTVEGIALKADIDILRILTRGNQVDATGAGRITLTMSHGITREKLGILNFTYTGVEGNEIMWRYAITFTEILAPVA